MPSADGEATWVALGALMDRICLVLKSLWAFVSVDLPTGNSLANPLIGI